MSNCKHKNMILHPGTVEKKGDGYIVKDLLNGEAFCKDCNEPLSPEDSQFYDEKHLFVGIPQKLE